MPADPHVISAEDALRANDSRLVDVVDGLLAQGIVLRGELCLSVADIDLVFVGIDLILAAPDTMAAARAPAKALK